MQTRKSDYLALLEEAGLTQAELARRLDIHPTTVMRWDEPPGYAMAYLNLYLKVKRFSQECL